MLHANFTRLIGTLFVEEPTNRFCSRCRAEEIFTDRICHAATSTLSLDLIRSAGLCERCGGAPVEHDDMHSFPDRSNASRLLACAYRDGQDCARDDEPLPDLWELIDQGYSMAEAVAFTRAYRGFTR